MTDWSECRHCGFIHNKPECPACAKEHARLTEKVPGRVYPPCDQGYGTMLNQTGRKIPPKYGWGG